MWFDENKSDLTEENPELSEEELFRLGMQRFKELAKDERQVCYNVYYTEKMSLLFSNGCFHTILVR